MFFFQIFHGVWTIAFFCLNVIDSRAILPNASCLLAGYLPATTVLHILLIPNDYPLEFIIIDAVGTFLAIITMFLLLRMECTGKGSFTFYLEPFSSENLGVENQVTMLKLQKYVKILSKQCLNCRNLLKYCLNSA